MLKDQDQRGVLFVFISYTASNIDKLKASSYGKLYFSLLKFGKAEALVYLYRKANLLDNKSITYIGYNNLFDRFTLSKMLLISRHIRRKNPGIVLLPGGASNRRAHFMIKLLCPTQTFAIVMATPSVSPNKWLRYYQNSLLKFNLMFFRNILIPKDWRFDRMSLSKSRIRFYQLGFYDFGFEPKDFSRLRLVYLGVFGGREIEKTIQGLALFLKKNPSADVSYDMIGKDTPEEASALKKTIKECNLDEVVRYHGFLPQEDAAVIIRSCNVGISYLPDNGIYGYSSTKTIEYLIAGLVVISTSSKFKDQYITESNGVIHSDNPQAFADALDVVYAKRYSFKPLEIRSNHLHLTLDSRVEASLIPLLKSLMNR